MTEEELFKDSTVFTDVQSLNYFDGREHRWVEQFPGELMIINDVRKLLKAERERSARLIALLKEIKPMVTTVQSQNPGLGAKWILSDIIDMEIGYYEGETNE